jgi:hypothetical protein
VASAAAQNTRIIRRSAPQKKYGPCRICQPSPKPVGAHDIFFQQKEVLHLVQQDEGGAIAREAEHKVAQLCRNGAISTQACPEMCNLLNTMPSGLKNELVQQRAQEACSAVPPVE